MLSESRRLRAAPVSTSTWRAIPVVGRPNAREGEQRAALVKREPHYVLFLVSGFGPVALATMPLAELSARLLTLVF
jgi:hypothetical protein